MIKRWLLITFFTTTFTNSMEIAKELVKKGNDLANTDGLGERINKLPRELDLLISKDLREVVNNEDKHLISTHATHVQFLKSKYKLDHPFGLCHELMYVNEHSNLIGYYGYENEFSSDKPFFLTIKINEKLYQSDLSARIKDIQHTPDNIYTFILLTNGQLIQFNALTGTGICYIDDLSKSHIDLIALSPNGKSLYMAIDDQHNNHHNNCFISEHRADWASKDKINWTNKDRELKKYKNKLSKKSWMIGTDNNDVYYLADKKKIVIMNLKSGEGDAVDFSSIAGLKFLCGKLLHYKNYLLVPIAVEHDNKIKLVLLSYDLKSEQSQTYEFFSVQKDIIDDDEMSSDVDLLLIPNTNHFLMRKGSRIGLFSYINEQLHGPAICTLPYEKIIYMACCNQDLYFIDKDPLNARHPVKLSNIISFFGDMASVEDFLVLKQSSVEQKFFLYSLAQFLNCKSETASGKDKIRANQWCRLVRDWFNQRGTHLNLPRPLTDLLLSGIQSHDYSLSSAKK